MLIEIKNRYTGAVLFSHDVVSNTIAITLVAAIASSADLSGADLRSADLRSADLYGANLRSADLSGADLRSADLYGANLHSADLSGADLRSADLYGANLHSANLYGANLRSADLSGADLRSADLYGANLHSANLYGANLHSAKNATLVIAQTRIIPDCGDIIGWKKCNNNVIVKLLIKDGTKRCHAMGRKCRAESAVVLEVIGADCGISKHDGLTKYITGETVTCDQWGEDWTVECSGGIHFFITRLEAENY